MELFKFLQSNWFQITLIISLIIFFIKITFVITNKLNLFNNTITELKTDIKSNKEERESEIKELSNQIELSKKERTEQISDLHDKLDETYIRISDETDSKIDKKVTDINSKLDNISSWLDDFNAKEEDKHERNILIMEGVEATLTTLHNAAFNGPVTKSLNDINEYKTRKATE